MNSTHILHTPTELESVVVTDQLQQRAPRPVDLERENAAFRELAGHFTAGPDAFLQKLVEITVKLCDADTVGISVEQTTDSGEEIFRWIAMAGELKHLIGGTTPRNFSPCGMCVDQNQPLLMHRLDRFYPYFREAPRPFVEALLLPWVVTGGPVGTLWVVAHSDRRKFDREDVRLMSCLAGFASGAILQKQATLETERATAAAQILAAMAHHINNPLQGAMMALFCAQTKNGVKADVRELLSIAEVELQRVAALSAELLQKTAAEVRVLQKNCAKE